jgi:hypothetical protein
MKLRNGGELYLSAIRRQSGYSIRISSNAGKIGVTEHK